MSQQHESSPSSTKRPLIAWVLGMLSICLMVALALPIDAFARGGGGGGGGRGGGARGGGRSHASGRSHRASRGSVRQHRGSRASRSNARTPQQRDRAAARPKVSGRPPAIGTKVGHLPNGYRTVKSGGKSFYAHGGRFYSKSGSRYVVVRPPIGGRIARPPNRCYRFWYAKRRYWYSGGAYYSYDEAEDDYEVVEPEEGMIVDDKPDGAMEVVHDGHTYYVYEGWRYEPMYQGSKLVYAVTKA